MSREGDHDLTGRWTGIYNYPRLLPPNSFEATLRDVAGTITGLTSEQDDDPHGRGGLLHAIVEGRREGSSVTFTKIYDEMEPEPVVIFYGGTVAGDGNEIQGRWERMGMWSGTFLMVRNTGTEEKVSSEIGEEVGPA
jgi:hypothetical protein